MSASNFNPFIFWAKLPRPKEEFPPQRFHPLLCHMIDVAAVVERLWQTVLPDTARRRFAVDLNLTVEAAGKWMALLAGLHDLGKLSPKFQFINAAEVLYKEKASLLHGFYRDTSGARCQTEAWHQWVTTTELPRILGKEPFGIDGESARRFAEILGGHHGTFPTITQLDRLTQYRKNCIGVGMWEAAREELTRRLTAVLEVPFDAKPQIGLEPIESNAFAMMFAGLVSVADWIGSNADYFKFAVTNINVAPSINAQEYLHKAREKADGALRMLGWHVMGKAHDAPTTATQSFSEIFAYLTPHNAFEPNEALRGYEWLSDEHDALPESLRVVIDAQSDDAEAETRMDVPVSFAARQFGVRYVKTDFIACPPMPEARARKEALRNVSFKINA